MCFGKSKLRVVKSSEELFRILKRRTILELQKYLLRREYPQENARCEWKKEFKNLNNSFCGDEKDDVVSYVSTIVNM